LPSYRMSGLSDEQLDELVARTEEIMEDRWDKETGRPKSLCLRDAVIVTCGYMRNNITEEVWAEIFGVSQPCISRYIKFLTPVICDAVDDFRPRAEEAAEATRGAIALVDGTLWPCWSWSGAKDLWAGKYKTTGHGSLVIANYDGDILYVSDPVTGNRHDMGKLADSESEKILRAAGGVFGDKGFIGTDYITTPVRKPEHRELYIREKEYNAEVSSHRAPIERAVAQLKTWRILFTDYRRPLETFRSSFNAAIGLYFFKLTYA
jgi:DDE superfamily endonuclease/Helix-turn-helix of DDE superfamily endonuclease